MNTVFVLPGMLMGLDNLTITPAMDIDYEDALLEDEGAQTIPQQCFSVVSGI